jgi:polyhydroxybutyrate depolymerase
MVYDRGWWAYLEKTQRMTEARRLWLSAVALAFVLTACGSSVASTPTPSARPSPSGAQKATMTVSGQVRTYTVFRPSSLDPIRPVPLVIALHGYTADARWMEDATHFDEQATQDGFIVVYPQGIDNSWNAGTCCGVAQSQNIDDVAFIRELIDRLVRDGHADPKRVFVTGMSNGAMMAHRLGCELSDRIAAIASVAGALITGACQPARPVSVLEMHGTEDSLVPFGGGSVAGIGQFPSTISFMRRWATFDGCTGSPTVTKSGITKTTTWAGCREHTAVILDAVTGAGHWWFGPDEDPAEPSATTVVWDFFSHVHAGA